MKCFRYSILIILEEECEGHPDELFSESSLDKNFINSLKCMNTHREDHDTWLAVQLGEDLHACLLAKI